MGPKKKDLEENSWRTNIENAVLNEETWQVKVVIFEAAGSDQDRIYLNKFEIFAAEEKRFVIKNICKTETIFMVNQLGGEKKVKDDNLRVFEEGQAFLKDKKDIPPDMLALIIKHLILKMKEEYLFIKKQKLEVKEGMRRESLTMVDQSEIRGTVDKKTSETVLSPKAKSKKGIDVPPEPEEGKKYNTNLRLRGEEWRDKVYVDDFPTDGPNIYVALTGFLEPLLPSNLIKIGIPLSAIVQIRIDQTMIKVPSTLLRATKRGKSQTEMLTEISLKFWEDLQLLRISKDCADEYKDTAFVIFSPPYWDSDGLSGNPDQIYDEMCYLMYDVQDLTRQHRHYLQNMEIINIPVDIKDDRFGKYYYQQIEDIPLECITFYSVVDSILETVCKSSEIKENSSRSSLSSAVTMNKPRKNWSNKEKVEKAEKYVKKVFNTLCQTEANRKVYRLTYGEEYENHKPPIIMNHGDFAKYSTFHLGNINLDNIVMSSMFRMPLHKLWDAQTRPHGELEAKINFHVNILLSCFQRDDVETAELNRLIHILACRKLYNNRSSLKKKHLASATISDFKKIYLKRSVLAEPMARTASALSCSGSRSPSFPSITKTENMTYDTDGEDPETNRINYLFDCPDISELISAAELANGAPITHMIDDFEYFEEFSGPSGFQILFDAFSKFNCVDYKYCEVTDCFVLMFFNSHDKDGIARDEWRCHLDTPLCLQDFFDFVLEEHYDWIQTEENIYDEAMQLKTQSEYHVIVDPNALKSCVGDAEVALDLLMEGSLKHQDYIETDKTPSSPKSNGEKSDSLRPSSPTSTNVDSKVTKKTKSPTTPKNRLRQSFMTRSTTSEADSAIPPKEFLGYDLGDRRVEVFGKDATFFSRDGTRVSCMYTLIIPTNVEYIIMSVVPGNNCNEFWLQRALGDSVTPDIEDYCQSFRIVSKDQVTMNLKKQSYKVPIPVTPAPNVETETQEVYDTYNYHSLFVTWPNGLVTESIYEENSSVISHIKQYYISSKPDLDEEMRCVSLKGEVIIFKKSGIIEVLKPDGSLIKITKCYQRLMSDPSSDKSKKGKGKDKGSNKSKASLKSKDRIHEEERKPSVYELAIEEYEYIETTGVRQRWTNEIPFFIENLLIRTATDFCLGEVFSRRMDGTHILLNKDGVQIVTFPDKTRIISKFIIEDEEIYPEWTEDEMYLFEMKTSENNGSETAKSKASMSQKSYIVSQISVSSSVSTKKVEIKEMTVEEEEEYTGTKTERIDGYVSVQIIYIIEHVNFTTVTVDKENNTIITIESPNNTAVVIDSENNYNISLDPLTKAYFNGANLQITYEACPECQSYTTCDIKVMPDEISSVTKIQQNWLKMKDSFAKRIIVNEEGGIILVDEAFSDESVPPEENEAVIGEESSANVDERQADRKSETSTLSHGKCREMYHAKTIRFLILRRDLTCSELIHRSLLELYNRACRWQPWCSITQHETFGDQRSLLSVLTPVHLTETEKWLMDSKLASKPKYLTYKDLKKDCGKGFYHWMRPYERFEPQPMKPDNALPPRLPRAFVLRTLEQQWRDPDREKYKGAKELLVAILKYRQIVESDCETLLHVPLVDLRPEDERRIDDVIQAVAHRIYEDLRIRLEDDVQSRAKADITTKPPPEREEMSIEGEQDEETDNLRQFEDDRSSLLKQIEDEEALSPNLKRYWRRRTEEFKEEQFYKYLLREGNVPPYFRNVLGGAIWWDMNDTAEQAVTKAERQKMKCVCVDKEQKPSDNELVPSFFTGLQLNAFKPGAGLFLPRESTVKRSNASSAVASEPLESLRGQLKASVYEIGTYLA